MLGNVIILSFFVNYAAAYTVCPMHVECIPGCVKIDQWGCKTCACGPMMFHPGAGYRGMPGGGMGGGSFTPGTLGGGSMFGSNQGSAHTAEKPMKDCTGTMLCMMTCKGHYSLGDVQQNGCRACTCPKPQEVVTVQEVKPAPQPVYQEVKPVTHHECTGTKLCMMTCKGQYVLGEKGSDGCQSCACIPEQKIQVVQPAPKEEECHETTLCMLSCKNGYSLTPKCNDGCHNECQKCTCLEEKPAVLIVQQVEQKKECPKTLECMLTCKDGYHLGSNGADGCPTCSCLAPQRVIQVFEVKCAQALSCPRGCSVGYKCNTDGCPTCECIEPHVIGVMTVKEIYTEQKLTCNSALSCPKSCSLGYKCGTDGCPICECCIEVHTVTNVKPQVQVTAPQPSTGVSTLISKCSGTVKCMSECAHGYTLGTEGHDGCPQCTCINTQTSVCHDVCEKKPEVAVHACDVTVQCMASCTNGYVLMDAGSDGCPRCACKQPSCTSGCEETTHVIQLKTSECGSSCESSCTGECGSTSGGTVQIVSGGSSGGVSSGGGAAMTGGGSSGGAAGGAVGGGSGRMGGASGGQDCAPLPPNCHPYCIKYDVAHCRICECQSTGTGAYGG